MGQVKWALGLNGAEAMGWIYSVHKTLQTESTHYGLNGHHLEAYQLSLSSLERLVSQACFYKVGRLVSEAVF